MAMIQPAPRRPALPRLPDILNQAHAALRAVRDDLRDAAARHAGQDPAAALALAQLAAGVDAVAARVPGRWPQPVTPDMWLVEADRLHEAVERARRGVWRLCDAAERDWPAAPDAPGAEALRQASIDITSALSAVCACALGVAAKLLPGVKAKARLSVRALVEDEDPVDLAALARDRAAELGPDNLNGLAWSALANLLAAEEWR